MRRWSSSRLIGRPAEVALEQGSDGAVAGEH